MIDFQQEATLSAARAHVSSLRWRLLVWALFAAASAFVLGSIGPSLGWYLALALSTGFDAMLGYSYLETRAKPERKTAGAMFVWGCGFSAAIFASMALYLAAEGGAGGGVLGVLMATSTFVGVMVFLSRAPGFMYVLGAPAAVALLAMPFIAGAQESTSGVFVVIGVVCGAAGFLAYVFRAASNINAMIEGLRAASREAKVRHVEAEARRAEAEEANRAKSRFLANMTHELRTPLNAVIGYAEIVAEDMTDDGRESTDVARIISSARHLLGVIDQLLNVSSADAGHEGIAARDVDVRATAEAAIEAVQDQARRAGDRISLRVSPDAATAHTDGGKLSVCLSALLGNAVKFTDKGFISVSATRENNARGEWLVLAVSDTGVGIAPTDCSKVFEPFVQLGASSKGGMGLGLAIAKRAALAMGGELGVASEPGRGSTFTLRVPMNLEAADARSAATQAAA